MPYLAGSVGYGIPAFVRFPVREEAAVPALAVLRFRRLGAKGYHLGVGA